MPDLGMEEVFSPFLCSHNFFYLSILSQTMQTKCPLMDGWLSCGTLIYSAKLFCKKNNKPQYTGQPEWASGNFWGVKIQASKT